MSDISEHNISGFESYLNVPTHLLKWAKKDSIPPGQMLEILLIWGELGHIFKENVLLFLVMIPYYMILSIWWLGMILIPTTMLRIIRDGKVQWMKSSTLSVKMQLKS